MGGDFTGDWKRIERTRKNLCCDWCDEPIYRMTPHMRSRGMAEGEFTTWRVHVECLDAIERWYEAARKARTDAEYMPGSMRRGCAAFKDDDCECGKCPNSTSSEWPVVNVAWAVPGEQEGT